MDARLNADHFAVYTNIKALYLHMKLTLFVPIMYQLKQEKGAEGFLL